MIKLLFCYYYTCSIFERLLSSQETLFVFFFVYVEFKMTFKLFLKSKKQLQIIRCSLLTMITLLLFSAGSFAVWLRYKEWPKMDSLCCLYFFYFSLSFTIITEDLQKELRSSFVNEKGSSRWKRICENYLSVALNILQSCLNIIEHHMSLEKQWLFPLAKIQIFII